MGVIKGLFIFASGLTIGSVVTWKLLDEKYKKISQDEIDQIRSVYSKRGAESKEVTEEVAEVVNTPAEKASYKDMISNLGYQTDAVDYSDISRSKQLVKEPEIDVERPYVIDPDEFGMIDGYSEEYLIYYADGVLADNRDHIVDYDEVDEVVGEDCLERMGEYEDDLIHVRNDRLKSDYEIAASAEKFGDLVGKYPFKTYE